MGLDEERRALRVEPRGEPVDQHLPHVKPNLRGIFEVGRERMPVGNEVEALMFCLKPNKVVQRPEQVSEVQFSTGLHAAQDTFPHPPRPYTPKVDSTAVLSVPAGTIKVRNRIVTGVIMTRNTWIWGSAMIRKKIINIP